MRKRTDLNPVSSHDPQASSPALPDSENNIYKSESTRLKLQYYPSLSDIEVDLLDQKREQTSKFAIRCREMMGASSRVLLVVLLAGDDSITAQVATAPVDYEEK